MGGEFDRQMGGSDEKVGWFTEQMGGLGGKNWWVRMIVSEWVGQMVKWMR